MLKEERIWHITQQMFEKQRVLSTELADYFCVSPATIRLDLAELERRGVARRVYGGAIPVQTSSENVKVATHESLFTERLEFHQEEKAAIGRAAAQLIRNGETLMIDGGTTTHHVYQHLNHLQQLTVISASVNFLRQNTLLNPNIQVFLIGGYLRPESLSLVGEFSEGMLKEFRANRAIMGVDGISIKNGFTAINFLEANVKKQISQTCEEVIVLADHTKFDNIGPIPVFPITRATTIVTDWHVSTKQVAAVEAEGVQVIVAQAWTGGSNQSSKNV